MQRFVAVGFVAEKRPRQTPQHVRGGERGNGDGHGRLPIPPFAEQAAIAGYLDKETAAIDAAMARARREIELLSEYRTRLIADVVTGQVDVREAAD